MHEFCQKIAGELGGDLYQELFLILCEKSDEWVEEKFNSGYWNGFVIRIALNQVYGKRTSFEKSYLRPIALYEVNEFIEQPTHQEINEYLHQSIEAVTNDLEWYEFKIWQLYRDGDKDKGIKPRSARSISKVTGISRQEILKVINDIKEKANEYFISHFGHSIDGIDFC